MPFGDPFIMHMAFVFAQPAFASELQNVFCSLHVAECVRASIIACDAVLMPLSPSPPFPLLLPSSLPPSPFSSAGANLGP